MMDGNLKIWDTNLKSDEITGFYPIFAVFYSDSIVNKML